MGLAYHNMFQIESKRSSNNDVNIMVPIIPDIINHEPLCKMNMGGSQVWPKEAMGHTQVWSHEITGGPGMIR